MAKHKPRNKRQPKATATVSTFDIFLQATRILAAARLTNDASWAAVYLDFPGPNERSKGSAHLIVPSQFLLVFALELHLKCLLSLRGKTIDRVHTLKASLFNKLPLADRRAARAHFTADALNDPDIQNLKTRFGIDLDLDLVLNSCEYVFQTFRYWHEYKGGSLFAPVRGRKRTRGTMGINIALAAIAKVILASPSAKDWVEQVDARGKFGTRGPAKPGKRQIVISSSGGSLEFTPKVKGKPEVTWE